MSIPYQVNEKIFMETCKDLNIEYVDMRECFLNSYDEYDILPNGFYNTSMGYGHLNRFGNRMVANELYKVISGEGLE